MKKSNKFVNAVVMMYENGSMDKYLNMKYTKAHHSLGIKRGYVRKEKREAKKLKAQLDSYKAMGRDLHDIPFIPLLANIRSMDILKDAICMMISDDV